MSDLTITRNLQGEGWDVCLGDEVLFTGSLDEALDYMHELSVEEKQSDTRP